MLRIKRYSNLAALKENKTPVTQILVLSHFIDEKTKAKNRANLINLFSKHFLSIYFIERHVVGPGAIMLEMTGLLPDLMKFMV